MKQLQINERGLRIFIVLFYVFLLSANTFAQTEGILKYQWNDDANITPRSDGQRYNEVWGFVRNNVEFAVIGSTMGTHIINLDDPENAYEEAFIPGKSSGSRIVHRDFHDYGDYLYSVCDQGSASLQVIDISQLPDTAFLVHQDTVDVIRSHNIFIDSARATLYTCGVRNNNGRVAAQIWGLEDPSRPRFIQDITEISSFPIGYVHDAFIRRDTIFFNAADQGLVIALRNENEEFELLSVLTNYEDQGYNHSGWLNERGDRYYMADETWGKDIKIIDVSDMRQPKVLALVNGESDPEGSIPHNLIVKNDQLYVSYYFDGLQIIDVSSDTSACRSFSYATSEIEPRDGGFNGAWGVYPLLPSELILVSDMENGLFIIELPELSAPDTNYSGELPLCDSLFTSTEQSVDDEIRFLMGPHNYFAFTGNLSDWDVSMYSVIGSKLELELVKNGDHFLIPTETLANGSYVVSLHRNGYVQSYKFNVIW